MNFFCVYFEIISLIFLYLFDCQRFWKNNYNKHQIKYNFLFTSVSALSLGSPGSRTALRITYLSRIKIKIHLFLHSDPPTYYIYSTLSSVKYFLSTVQSVKDSKQSWAHATTIGTGPTNWILSHLPLTKVLYSILAPSCKI